MTRWNSMLGVALSAFLAGGTATFAGDDDKPSISVRATPTFAFAPARIVMRADLRGGADDYEEYYCPSVEWEWGDGTESEALQDCEPYEAGKSQIKRRFVAEHTFQESGRFRVVFKLKRNNKVVAASNVTVEIRPGIREPY